MSQALDVLTIISELSAALAKLGTRVDTESADGGKRSKKNKKAAASGADDVAKKTHTRVSQNERAAEEASRDMASITHDLNARLEAQPLPDWVDGTSVATLTALTASNQRLMSLTRTQAYNGGISAQRYAQMSAAAHELIRDVSDYGRAVIVSQIEQVRAQNFTGDKAVDMRPAKASVEAAAAHGVGGAYNVTDDEQKQGGATAFDESELNVLGGDLSAYHTPSSSAAVTPVSSRPPSPPLEDDGEPDLMGIMSA